MGPGPVLIAPSGSVVVPFAMAFRDETSYLKPNIQLESHRSIHLPKEPRVRFF